MNVSLESLVKQLLMISFLSQQQPQLLCGQAYNGAGAMAGKSKGDAYRILRTPKLYTHIVLHTD